MVATKIEDGGWKAEEVTRSGLVGWLAARAGSPCFATIRPKDPDLFRPASAGWELIRLNPASGEGSNSDLMRVIPS